MNKQAFYSFLSLAMAAGALLAMAPVATRAQAQAQLTPFVTAGQGQGQDLYHITEAPDGSFFIAEFNDRGLLRVSAAGQVLEVQRSLFLSVASVAFINNDFGYTACVPAPVVERGFCLGNTPGCPKGAETAFVNGVSNPRYVLGASGGLTNSVFFIANGGTGQILRFDRNARSLTTIAGGFTIATSASETRGPEQIAYNRQSRMLFVPDSGKGTIVAINESNGSQTALRSGLNQPFGLVLLPNGNLLAANRGDGTLMEISQTGQLINTYDTGQSANAIRGLWVSQQGQIYLVGDKARTIFRVTLPAVTTTTATTVSAASFSGTSLASEAIVSAFGTNLATATEAAATLPLPTTLAGTTVRVRDSAGIERQAPLFFVSAGQVNYLIPAGTAAGSASVAITSGSGAAAAGSMQIAAVAPGLFTANADGQGAPAAIILRRRAGQPDSFEPVAQLDAATNRFVPAPISLGAATDQVFLLLFGTGIRFRASLAGVTARIGGETAEVFSAGAQGDFAGLDQVNLTIPRSLAGRGEVDLELTVDGAQANTVRLLFR